MVYIIVLAGGSGERLWPLSKRKKPKQLVNILGGKSLLEQTVSRAGRLVTLKNIFIVTNAGLREEILKLLPFFPLSNILEEPDARSTAPALAFAASQLRVQEKDPVLVALPADHMVTDEQEFIRVLGAAVKTANDFDAPVVIGVRPTRPETGYGYILYEPCLLSKSRLLNRVSRFVEKPERNTAEKYLAAGGYLWHTGITILRLSVLKSLVEKHLPSLSCLFKSHALKESLKSTYRQMPAISIEYGILEKEENLFVIPGDFGWDDLGSWTAVAEHKEKDPWGNTLEGKGALVETSNTLILSSQKVIAALGVKDLIIIESEDSILVCHKSYDQEIKKVTKALAEKGITGVL